MPEPLVSTLVYRPVVPAEADYGGAPPLAAEIERMTLHLTADRLMVRLKGGPLPESEARATVDEALRTWEIAIGLLHGPDHLTFRFEHAEHETPAIPAAGSQPPLNETILLTQEITPPTVHDRFPDPPRRFRLSAETEMMYLRYRLYRAGRESLTGVADWCLTVLEYSARGRAESADQYGIDPKVLRKLRELCGQRGVIDQRHPQPGTPQLKPAEREWIRAVVRRLILRAGEYAFDPVSRLPRIALTDFPPLP